MKSITQKQKEVLQSIKTLFSMNGKSPTLEEIRKFMNYSSTGSVQRHITPLIKKGYLKNKPNIPRSLEIVEETEQYIDIPLVGNIACGKAIYAEENIEAYIPYPKSQTHFSMKELFFLRANGDSMNLAKVNGKPIEHGDYVLIRKQNVNEDGKPVVVLIGEDATIKYLKKDLDKGAYVLEPKSSNSQHKLQLLFDEFWIQGVAIDIIKPNF